MAAKQATLESANCNESLKKAKCPGKCFIVLLHKQVPVAQFNNTDTWCYRNICKFPQVIDDGVLFAQTSKVLGKKLPSRILF